MARGVVSLAVAAFSGLAFGQGERVPQVYRSSDAHDRTVVRDRPLLVLPPRSQPEWLVTRAPKREGNGRVWASQTIVGGASGADLARWDQRERSEFGAAREEEGRVVVYFTYEPVVVSPWADLTGTAHGGLGRDTLATAQQLWLREQGFTGGVRRFVRPAGAGPAIGRADDGARPVRREIEPSVIIWPRGGERPVRENRGPVAVQRRQ
ncbi:MAG: hypothetical protein AAFR38_03955 [Planctomycetota bacterium]